jgi:isocitrate dehydrogenase (NAD+)
MLLRHISFTEKAQILENALELCDNEGKVVVTGNKDGATCEEYGEYVISKL